MPEMCLLALYKRPIKREAKLRCDFEMNRPSTERFGCAGVREAATESIASAKGRNFPGRSPLESFTSPRASVTIVEIGKDTARQL
ncbi:MAG: hypothetical protein DMF04_11585 [Verrucomicrobia bacterium]|nr:MAG: hypothetical protein DMF04_11585 [Verrucomicrobiota bacterium]